MFAGRAAELDALAACERPGLALVEGPAGVGKTALIERFLSGERRVWRASGERLEESLAAAWSTNSSGAALHATWCSTAVSWSSTTPTGRTPSRSPLSCSARRRSTGGLFIVAVP